MNSVSGDYEYTYSVERELPHHRKFRASSKCTNFTTSQIISVGNGSKEGDMPWISRTAGERTGYGKINIEYGPWKVLLPKLRDAPSHRLAFIVTRVKIKKADLNTQYHRI